MKKFRFRLDVVERHREIQEQDKRLNLSKSIQSLRNVEKNLLELDSREVAARRQFSSLGGTDNAREINSSSFWILDQFIQGQKFRRIDLQNQLQEKETQVSYAYREFLHARQQKKIMEKLHETKEEEYKALAAQHEKREMDDLYTMRHRLKKDDGGNDEA